MRIKFIAGVLKHQRAKRRKASQSRQESPQVGTQTVLIKERIDHMDQEKLDLQQEVPGEGTLVKPDGTVRSGQKKSGSKDGKSQLSKLAQLTQSVKQMGLNVFYGAVSVANRHKYSVSHYDVQTMPFLSTYLPVDPNNVGVTLAEHQNTLPLGGPVFKRKVREAAMAANSRFLVTTGNLDNLINAFYWHMTMSRALYADLCTAWRCQQLVNAIDEDGVYISPLFNNHTYGAHTKGWSYFTYAKESDASTFATNTIRHQYCYASPTSNGVWLNSVVAPILQATRLPQNWYLWAEEMFSRIHFVSPSDYMTCPRAVVFWPSSYQFKDNGSGKLIADDYTGYFLISSASTYNASITNLIQHINFMVTQMTSLMDQFPQLEIMFNLLEMKPSQFNFTRDLDAKTVPCDFSYDIAKFIESAATGTYKMVQSGVEHLYSRYDAPFGNSIFVNHRVQEMYVSQDPRVDVQGLPQDRMKSMRIGSANLMYKDRVILSQSQYAMMNTLIAPINCSILVRNSQNKNFMWLMPNDILQDTGVMGPNWGGFSTDEQIRTAMSELLGIQTQQAMVLPRIRLVTYGTPGSNTDTDGSFYASFTRYLDLKDYYVPAYESRAWSDALADILACN